MLKIKLFNIIGALALLIITVCSEFVIAEPSSEKAYNYIEKYKYLAVEEMHRMGIPASITLAQGMLESGYGESRLARVGRNHFGIKCKSYWKGDTVRITDDRPKECFRKYHSVEESYRDHSKFLYYHPQKRYKHLFNLDRTDYTGWAVGLKKAGYATNPKYANLLIKLIERYSLDQFDHVLPQDILLAEKVRPPNRNFQEVYPARPNRPVPQYGVGPEVYTRYPNPTENQAQFSNHNNSSHNTVTPSYPWNNPNALPANSYNIITPTPIPPQVYQAPPVVEQQPQTIYVNNNHYVEEVRTPAPVATPPPVYQTPPQPQQSQEMVLAEYPVEEQMENTNQEVVAKTVKTMKIHSGNSATTTATARNETKVNKKSRLIFTIAPAEEKPAKVAQKTPVPKPVAAAPTPIPAPPIERAEVPEPNTNTTIREELFTEVPKTETIPVEVEEQPEATPKLVAMSDKKKNASTAIPPTLAETEINGRRAVLANKAMKLDYVAHKYDISVKKLVNLNEIASHLVIPSNTPIFLEAKRSKSSKGIAEHVVKRGETLASISQKYGVKLKSLYKINRLYPNARPVVGQVIYLRKKRS